MERPVLTSWIFQRRKINTTRLWTTVHYSGAAQTPNNWSAVNEAGKRTLPLCTITDILHVLHRGTVEGFYGTP